MAFWYPADHYSTNYCSQDFIKLDQFCLAIHRIKYVIILLPFVALCKTMNIDYKTVNKAVVKMKRVLHVL